MTPEEYYKLADEVTRLRTYPTEVELALLLEVLAILQESLHDT